MGVVTETKKELVDITTQEYNLIKRVRQCSEPTKVEVYAEGGKPRHVQVTKTAKREEL